jgi:hypothetical protein
MKNNKKNNWQMSASINRRRKNENKKKDVTNLV